MAEYWGQRCEDRNDDCPCCQAWQEYETFLTEMELLHSFCDPYHMTDTERAMWEKWNRFFHPEDYEDNG